MEEMHLANSVEKGPLVWPSITVDGVTRLKEYTELTPAEAIQADCDIKAINIILQGLPTEIYALVSQHRVAKDLWEKIKLLIKERPLLSKNESISCTKKFDKFTYKERRVNTLPDEWSKFVTDVKLVKDLHTTNVDQLHAYLEQHERHGKYKTRSNFSVLLEDDDPIAAINLMMGDKLLLLWVLQGLTLQEQVEAILENKGWLFATTAKGKDAYDTDCDDLNSAKLLSWRIISLWFRFYLLRILKDGGEDKEFQRSFRHSDTERLSRSDEVLKLKNFKKDATLKLFKSTNQERYEHVGSKVTSSQDGKTRLCLVDDLKVFKESHSRQDEEQAQDLTSMITTSIHKIEVYELKTKDKA
ncbi:hypothetical protein Tco_0718619 [Tanacetum coccineum]